MTPARRTIALVAWREITERMRSRAFAIATIAIIAVVVAGVVLPGLGDDTVHLRVGVPRRAPCASRCATPRVPTTHNSICAATRRSPPESGRSATVRPACSS